MGIDRIYPDGIAKANFQKRKNELIEKAGQLLVEIVVSSISGEAVGYCLSTINERGIGELDSIFLEESFRGKGIGREFVRRALEWMDGVGVQAKKVNVLEVNQEAVGLYREFGFRTRQLEMVIPKS
ncbi:MAG: GNAT family N-acetyltransferase [Verrucomicrobiota bacterium]